MSESAAGQPGPLHDDPSGPPASQAESGASRGALKRIGDVWRRARRRWYGRWAIDLSLLMLVFWAIGRYQSRHLLADDQVAPAFRLADLDGAQRALSDYRGKVVVLQFFAPWCTVCSLESDNWARIQSWRPDVQVLAVALAWEDKASVLEFVGDDRGRYPVLLGTDTVQEAYKVDSFPTHYIIDAEGRIAWQGSGYTPTVGMLLRLL